MPELGGNPQNIYSSWNPVNKCFGFLFFLLIELAYNPAIPLLDIHPTPQTKAKFTQIHRNINSNRKKVAATLGFNDR